MNEERIYNLGIINQWLIRRSLRLGMYGQAKELQWIDAQLTALIEHKQTNNGFYIWHTQWDAWVRGSHADNEGQVFSWKKPPATRPLVRQLIAVIGQSHFRLKNIPDKL
jgi:hypothetical protein